MEEFRRLEKSDLHEIITVAKQSYDDISLKKYVLDDIICSFDKTQRYKVELYGYFRNDKLIHFCGIGKSLGIGSAYELRLSTTLPEFRSLGYATKSLDMRLAIIEARERDYKTLIQVTTRKTEPYKNHGFVETGYVSRSGFIYLAKIIGM